MVCDREVEFCDFVATRGPAALRGGEGPDDIAWLDVGTMYGQLLRRMSMDLTTTELHFRRRLAEPSS